MSRNTVGSLLSRPSTEFPPKEILYPTPGIS
jgi:hypothetical protein